MSKFATSPPARNLDMSPVLDDACDTTSRDSILDTMPEDAMLDTMPDTARDVMPDDTMPDTARDAMLDTALPDDARDAILPDDAMLDTARDTTLPDVPLGVFLDAHIARVTANARDAYNANAIEIEPAFAPARSSSPRYELPDIPEGYVMEGEIAKDFLACHPKRIDQDSQRINADTPSHPKEKKKDDRNLHASSPNTITLEEPNDISASDAETQSGDEHEPGDNVDSDVHNNALPSHDEDVEIEPTVNPDNPQPKRYDKKDFTARNHGKEIETWVQRPMLFPPKSSKKKDDEDFECFVEMIRPVFLQMRLTDILKMSPYAKYMKDIVTNKRNIPDLEISTMLANYTFKGGTPKKLGDPGVPTIPCSIKGNYVRTALCDLGAGVSVMPLSLYLRLELDKLTPTEISLQMADKSTAFPIGISEDVPVVVANTTILTDFVILDIPEDDAMAIILGRPFLNTAGAIIDCNKGNVTFHVNGMFKVTAACPTYEAKNFPLWKKKMQMHLQAIDNDLWYIVEHGVPMISASVSAADVKKFKQLDSQAKNIICGHLSLGQFGRVSALGSTTLIWERLCKVNEGVSTQRDSRVDILRNLFNRFKRHDNESCQDTFDRLTDISNELQALGARDITDHEVVKKLLRSLDSSFDTLVLMIQERPDYKMLDPDDILERPNTHEFQLEEKRVLYGPSYSRPHALKARAISSSEDEDTDDNIGDPEEFGQELAMLVRKFQIFKTTWPVW
ncbi:hypothetical protein ZWY2020_010789 [Hordeum vulgare]|nr:hypothetical protein ZWY2020_010789 [Hordeum vulgare]